MVTVTHLLNNVLRWKIGTFVFSIFVENTAYLCYFFSFLRTSKRIEGLHFKEDVSTCVRSNTFKVHICRLPLFLWTSIGNVKIGIHFHIALRRNEILRALNIIKLSFLNYLFRDMIIVVSIFFLNHVGGSNFCFEKRNFFFSNNYTFLSFGGFCRVNRS